MSGYTVRLRHKRKLLRIISSTLVLAVFNVHGSPTREFLMGNNMT
jgi:hypothetical protein